MFSRILKSAKSLVSNPAAAQLTAAPTTIILDETMVRTGRSEEDVVPAAASSKVEDEGETEENTIVVDTSPSSQKSRKRRQAEDIGENDFEPPSTRSRKRRQVEDIGEADFEPTPKKRESLPVREKDEATPNAKMKVVVEIPIKNFGLLPASQSTREGSIADSQGEDELSEVDDGAKAEISASQESRFDGVEEIPSSDPRDNESELEFESQEYSERLPRMVEVDADEKDDIHENAEGEGSGEDVADEPTPKPASKHKRFDSAEPEEQIFSTASEAIAIHSDHSESGDSDDEAPEAVPTQAAAKTAKLKEQEAANAIKEQLTATRIKRKERESALKKQAEKKRRKEAKALARQARKSAQTATDDVLPSTEPKQKLNPSDPLPNLLPLSYLSDTNSDEDLETEAAPEPARRARKTKFSDLAAEKKVKDKRVGKTTYRVEKRSSGLLAPKAAWNARRIKEGWMVGAERKGAGSEGKKSGKGDFAVGERRVAKGGFLKR